MALINCPECGREISSSAPSCPHCGYVLSRKIKEPVKNELIEKVRTQLYYLHDSEKVICKNCGRIDFSKTSKGKEGIATCLILIFIFFISCGIGLIMYFIWELFNNKTHKEVCSMCGSESIIPVTSPQGLEMLSVSREWQNYVNKRNKKTEEKLISRNLKEEKKRVKEEKTIKYMSEHPYRYYGIRVLIILVSFIILAFLIDILMNPQAYF